LTTVKSFPNVSNNSIIDKEEEFFLPVGSISYASGKCSDCGRIREVITLHNFTGTENFGNRSILSIGLPAFDVFTARSRTNTIHILMDGDKNTILSDLKNEIPHIWSEAKSSY